MVQFFDLTAGRRERNAARREIATKLGLELGKSLGEGLGTFIGDYQANKALQRITSDKEFAKKPLSEQAQLLQTGLSPYGSSGAKALERQLTVQQQVQKEQQEARQKKAVEQFAKQFGLKPEEVAGLTVDQLLDYAKIKDKRDELNRIFGPQTPSAAQPGTTLPVGLAKPELLQSPAIGAKPAASQQEFNPLNYTDEQIIRAEQAGIKGLREAKKAAEKKVADEKKANAALAKEERKATREFEAEKRKETLPIRQDYAQRADIARRGIENKEESIRLINTGKINDPTFATILTAIPLNFGERFLSPETVQYRSGLVQGYGDLRNIFTGATRVKEIEILEHKIPDLYLTDNQKKSILTSSLKAARADIIREEAAEEVERKMPNIGALQFRREVEKAAKPKLDALFNQIIDEQNFIVKDAENRKKVPLNYDDPEDKQIIDQLYNEAGRDWKAAEKLAQKKGYRW